MNLYQVTFTRPPVKPERVQRQAKYVVGADAPEHAIDRVWDSNNGTRFQQEFRKADAQVAPVANNILNIT